MLFPLLRLGGRILAPKATAKAEEHLNLFEQMVANRTAELLAGEAAGLNTGLDLSSFDYDTGAIRFGKQGNVKRPSFLGAIFTPQKFREQKAAFHEQRGMGAVAAQTRADLANSILEAQAAREEALAAQAIAQAELAPVIAARQAAGAGAALAGLPPSASLNRVAGAAFAAPPDAPPGWTGWTEWVIVPRQTLAGGATLPVTVSPTNDFWLLYFLFTANRTTFPQTDGATISITNLKLAGIPLQQGDAMTIEEFLATSFSNPPLRKALTSKDTLQFSITNNSADTFEICVKAPGYQYTGAGVSF